MDDLGLSSRSYFLWNNSLGVEVGGVEADTATAVASMTKVMTALVTLENAELDALVEITPEMLSGLAGYAVVGLQPGQQVTVEDLLYATLLPSAGDAAQALAFAVSGSIEEFAELMNERAQSLGMTGTHFSNPVGKDEENVSTPRDIAMLLREALQNPTFVEMFETFEKELPSLGKAVRKTFVRQGYIKGGKTGYTEEAGRCLASTAEIEGTEYILVTVGAANGQNTVDAAKIYNWVKDNYEPMQLLTTGEKILQIGVKQSATKTLEFVADQDVVVALENGITEADLTYEYEGVEEITPEMEVGAKLGEWQIRQGENLLYQQEIYYREAPEFYNYGWMALGGGVSAGLLIAVIVAFVMLGRRKKRSKKMMKGLLGGGLILLLAISVAVNYIGFREWFEPGGETEVLRPEAVQKQAAEAEQTEINEETEVDETPEVSVPPKTSESSGDDTEQLGNLMLINPNFMVDRDFIARRKTQLISVSKTYGIPEYNSRSNGDNLLMPEAAKKLYEMVTAYEQENPGHEMGTRSCFRERGTSCGRLCAVTGASDHHTGLTCDLIDNAYGTSLDTDDYWKHKEWQWLRENSYKYGFIDRFPEEWAGGSMTEPLNVDENGTTGLFETWHYRYVGVEVATEIATGKYNGGRYDSLEHYLKVTGRVTNLLGR